MGHRRGSRAGNPRSIAWTTARTHRVYPTRPIRRPRSCPYRATKATKLAYIYITSSRTTIRSPTLPCSYMRTATGGHAPGTPITTSISNPLSVRLLNTATVEKQGFANMRCNTDPGCPSETQLFRDPPEPHRRHEMAMPDALKDMFGWERHELPAVLATACCSQFAVSRSQVHRRSKAEYERYYQWLMDTPLDDDVSGRVLEYLWHVIFGKPPVWCPEMAQCYCDMYGMDCK